MLVTRDGELVSKHDRELLVVSAGENTYYISGFFYIPGFVSGEPSIRELHRQLTEKGEIPFDKLYGSFSCMISSDHRIQYLFPCNSELHCIYYSDYAMSDRFLELVDYHKKHNLPLTFDDKSVCEYYSLGNYFFNKTLVKEIHILKNDLYIKWAGKERMICEKKISDISGQSSIADPSHFYDDLATALSNNTVAISLTGGYDSRLVYSQLYKKIPLFPFFSANVETMDSVTAEKAAKAVGKELKVFYTEKPEVTQSLIQKMIKVSDGLQPLDFDSDYRILSFREKLRENGYTVQLTGDGGVLHKDWEWMQDLPFYHRKKTNLRRFYYQRIAYACSAPHIGDKLKNNYLQQEARFLKELEPLKKAINTESYDSLYHYASGNRKIRYNYVSSSAFTLYAPLNELDLVRYTYHMPRHLRFYYNYMRKMITDADTKLARVPTNYGTTASSEPLYLFRDSFVQLKEYGVKAKRLMRRKLRLPSQAKKVIDWNAENELRNLSLAEDAVKWAVKENLLEPGTEEKSLPYVHLQRIVHLFVLHDMYGLTIG